MVTKGSETVVPERDIEEEAVGAASVLRKVSMIDVRFMLQHLQRRTQRHTRTLVHLHCQVGQAQSVCHGSARHLLACCVHSACYHVVSPNTRPRSSLPKLFPRCTSSACSMLRMAPKYLFQRSSPSLPDK